ncbi:hypothetical protein GCM10010378_09480 [Streptomyces viridochromogenes]
MLSGLFVLSGLSGLSGRHGCPGRGGPVVVMLLGGLLGGVRRAVGVPAGAGDPGGDPGSERLVTPDDRLDGLSTGGTDVLFAAHVPRVGRLGAQRFLLYVRTTAPLPKPRTSSRVNSVTEKPEANIGMPVP